MAAGIFLNSVVVISLWRSTQLRKRLCYFTIFLLSCFNLTVVVINHPISISQCLARFFHAYEDLHDEVIMIVCMLLHCYSMLALLTLNLERFLALNYPFVHQKSVTKRRVVLFLSCLCLFFSILIGLTIQDVLMSHEEMELIYFSFFLLIFLYLTYKILKVSKTKSSSYEVAYNPATKLRRVGILKKISTCYLALACFVAFCIPKITYCSVCIGYWRPNEKDCDVKYFQWIDTVISMNSTFNCLIFFWGNTILRREGKNVIKRFSVSLLRKHRGHMVSSKDIAESAL